MQAGVGGRWEDPGLVGRVFTHECWQCISQADPVVSGLPCPGAIVGPGECFQNLPSLSFRTQFDFEDFKAFTQELWKKRRANLDSSTESAEPGGLGHQAGLPGVCPHGGQTHPALEHTHSCTHLHDIDLRNSQRSPKGEKCLSGSLLCPEGRSGRHPPRLAARGQWGCHMWQTTPFTPYPT